MPETYDLSREIGITELNLSAGEYSKDGENILVLGNKPDSLENKEIRLRYAKTRDWSSSKPEAFFAEAGVFNERELKTPWSVLAQDGWSFKTQTDPDGNRTIKKYYVRIENKNSDQVYIGVPVTKYHFGGGRDPVIDDLLIIDEQSFIDNPNFAISLNHQKINIEAKNGHWSVAKDDPLGGIIKLPGHTIEANNPEEIYLLTEAEIAQYNKKGARKGWSEESFENPNDLRLLVKKESKNGQLERIDRRFAKKIMVPQTIDGEKKLVKHFLLSDQKTLESLEIMAPITNEEQSVIQENAIDAEPETQLTKDEVVRLSEADTRNITELPDYLFDQDDPGYYSDLEERSEPEIQSESEMQHEAVVQAAPEKQEAPKSPSVSKVQKVPPKKKAEYTGMALEIFQRIGSTNGGTVSPSEKAFLDELNLIQDDPEKVEKALASIQNSPDHHNIIKQFVRNEDSLTSTNEEKPENTPSDPPISTSTSVGGAEAAFGAAAGLATGFVKGVGGLAGATVGAAVGLGGGIVKGTLGEINNIINNHHKRKLYRLEHPEIVEQEEIAKKEKLMATRQAIAEDSNRILDAKIASVIASKQYIDQNPAVQQMYDMISNDPSQSNNLAGWLEETANGNPVFAEHLDNVMKNAGNVAREIEENFKANNLAGGDLEERKAVFEKYNEYFANDPLADVLPDTGVNASDGEQQASIRESITKAINTIMKMLKDVMLVLLGKKKMDQSESVVERDNTSPAMSR